MRCTLTPLAALAVASFTIACGARSHLQEGGAASASGGGSSTTSSSSSSSSSSGTGGSGAGGGLACPALHPIGDPVAILSAQGTEQQPQLVATGQGVGQVTLAFQWLPLEGPGMFSEVRHVALDPWGAWPPPSIPSSNLATNVGGQSFATAASSYGNFALLYAAGPPGPSSGVTFTEMVTPGVDGTGSNIEIDPLGLRAVFAAYDGGDRHLVGFEDPFVSPPTPTHRLLHAVVHSPPADYLLEAPIEVGCVDTPIVADALRVDDGWLRAGAMDIDHPCDNVGPPPPALQLYVSFLGDQGGPQFGSLLEGGNIVQWLALADRGQGAWLAYHRPDHDADGPIEAVHLDAKGATVAGPFTLIDDNKEPRWLSVDNLDQGLAVVWADTLSNGPPLLTVSIFGDDGTLLADAPVKTGGWAGGVPAIIGSPTGTSVLVAWTEQTGDGIGDEVFVQRFDCVFAPD